MYIHRRLSVLLYMHSMQHSVFFFPGCLLISFFQFFNKVLLSYLTAVRIYLTSVCSLFHWFSLPVSPCYTEYFFLPPFLIVQFSAFFSGSFHCILRLAALEAIHTGDYRFTRLLFGHDNPLTNLSLFPLILLSPLLTHPCFFFLPHPINSPTAFRAMSCGGKLLSVTENARTSDGVFTSYVSAVPSFFSLFTNQLFFL